MRSLLSFCTPPAYFTQVSFSLPPLRGQSYNYQLKRTFATATAAVSGFAVAPIGLLLLLLLGSTVHLFVLLVAFFSTTIARTHLHARAQWRRPDNLRKAFRPPLNPSVHIKLALSLALAQEMEVPRESGRKGQETQRSCSNDVEDVAQSLLSNSRKLARSR